MANIRPSGSPEYCNGISVILQNIRRTGTGGALIRAIAADRHSAIVIEPRGLRAPQCSLDGLSRDELPFARETALLRNHSPQYQTQQIQRSHALGAPLLHVQGHQMNYSGTGGGTDSATVRINPSYYCDNKKLQVALAHELVHGLRMIAGQQIGQLMYAWDRMEEFVACTIENIMRSEIGLGLRASHGHMVADRVMVRFYISRSALQPSHAPQPSPARPTTYGVMQTRPPHNPVLPRQIAPGQVERFFESIMHSDPMAFRSLAQGFAAEHKEQLRLVRHAHPQLVGGPRERQGGLQSLHVYLKRPGLDHR